LTTEAPINKWAEDKTNGKIKDLLAPGSITPDVVMVLANAIYFKGDWLYKFDSLKTEKEWFYKEDGSKAKTKLMHIESSFSYAENEDYQALELPYKGNELVMRIFLPQKNRSIEYLLEQKVLETQATGWRSNVQVFLPKMELETSYDLKKPLEELGLLSMFSDANFSGMADVPLKVDKMLQKAYLKVDEKGTEAEKYFDKE
jgi:serpin B